MLDKRKTKRKQFSEISAYLEEHEGFYDAILSSFSYDSKEQTISLTIEEDIILSNQSVPSRLIWHFVCEGVSNVYIDDMKSSSKWQIYEIVLEEDIFYFKLFQGYISFKTRFATLYLPPELRETPVSKITKLQIDYLIQEFKEGKNIAEISFSFEDESQDFLSYIGYSEDENKPYWAVLPDLLGRKYFKTVDELFDIKLCDGCSLKEKWDDVKIYTVNTISLDDWLTNVSETCVYENEEDYDLYINGVQLDGNIIEDLFCEFCEANLCYLDDYDDYFCPYCNLWRGEDFWDEDEYFYFAKRPIEPALLWRPNKILRFCQVQFSDGGKSYSYYCSDSAISVGDLVTVNLRKSNCVKEVRVSKIFQAPANNPSYPIDKIKTIGKKIKSFTEEVSEILDSLLTNGIICDLSKEQLPTDSSLAYHVLKTPIGHFWLELNNCPIKMSIRVCYPKVRTDYTVEAIYDIKSFQNEFANFESLKVCTDIDFSLARLIDNLGGEHKDGYNWQVGEYDIGIVAYSYSYLETEVAETLFGIPCYIEWDNTFKDLYGFTVAWKYYDSEEDESIWFNI